MALYRAPQERPDYDAEDILWKIASSTGSKLESYVVGVTPQGFIEDVPLTSELAPGQGLAVLVEVEQSGDANVIFTIQDLREDRILRGGVGGDKYLDPDDFRARHLERCSS